MISIHLTVFYALILFLTCYILLKQIFSKKESYSLPSVMTIFLFAGALLLRLTAAFSSQGNAADLACFSAWSERIFLLGPGDFYSHEVFTDYPPGYMYLLWPVGALLHLLQVPYASGLRLLLLKLPAICCDLLTGGLLYREGRSRLHSAAGLILASAYLYNPAIFLNSAIWGQVDSVFTLALVILCLCLVHNRLPGAYLAFCAGVLLKPQMLIFTPVLLAGIVDQVFLRDFHPKKLLRSFLQGMGAFLLFLLLCLPFGLKQVLAQYTDTLGSYPYASVNAYNFYSLLGFNWVSQDTTLGGIPLRIWGMAAICLITAGTLLFSLLLRKDTTKYPFLCALVILTMFTCSVRMHERYLYPGLICLLFAFLYRPCRSLFICYGAFSILHFYNTAHVLYFYDPDTYDPRSSFIRIISLGTVCCLVYLYHSAFYIYLSPALRNPAFPPLPSSPKLPFDRRELLFLIPVMLLYSIFALYDLGDRTAPESVYAMEQGESIRLSFEEGAVPASLSYYIAPWHDRHFTVTGILPEDSPNTGVSETAGYQTDLSQTDLSQADLSLGSVFTWEQVSLPLWESSFEMTLTDESAHLLELVFLDESGNILLPKNASDYPALFDEQDCYPARSSFRNSMYFDEIYHARTAYEFLHGLVTYENTHPPLGKILISVGILIFGMNPFGWRIIGTLFGVLMLPFVYLSARKLTENRPLSALACFLFAFDFMHFTQTRIATIDVYVTFFVILMYYFMYCYVQMSFYDRPLRKTLRPLGACGLCMGLGIACKWTGIYAGAGLAVLFFSCLYRRYQEYRYAKADPAGSTCGISHSHILKSFPGNVLGTICFCLLFFVLIPAGIYLLSYLPFRTSDPQASLFSRMAENQVSMFSYHSSLDATHPYASSWYQWPTMVRPVWYYSGIAGDTLREGISSFGNPLVWWVGIPAFFHMIYLAVRKKDRTAAFLLIGYLAQYLPWFFVTRITFLYHYFPSVPFLVLMIVYGLLQWKKRLSNRFFLFLLSAYGIAAFCLFLLFYPVLSGQPVEISFADRYLRWFDTWVLISH